ncbi:hypothetical protein [Desulfococcus multivorans]|uniref:Uncharacterized protein n=1 Tax=Desulfococcus multivorans DSM 2059 TaxID=1121405 RepID=S7TFH4_DESML|nr:hypothetical protein [Desulfococcus multivorans]AOY59975.1 uncharacterized protein Dmul_32050 [Desulfococcus multivorans]AQV02122.1 hypothetical protein B2D07_16045 [Desulfococcus multivorans]EPR35972.1 hypothetical protein dsmv_0677 [Desulfococcus multivorans DSM 2059]SJZ36055.1 hypothetical protein SAMN02745446_00195 [Desulfococcus multivorans DSM 2059]
MRHPANSFTVKDLLCFPNLSAPLSYYFVPLHADLDRSETGTPLWNLISLGQTGYLMLTAAWRASEQSLAALRTEIARQEAIADPTTLRLAPAPAQVARCNLLLGDGAGQFQVIATSATSGIAPYSALFNLFLTEEQFAAVAAALTGNPRRLAVEYDVALAAPVTGSARFIPLSSQLLPRLAEYLDSGPPGFRLALQAAVEEGLAMIDMDLPEQASEGLVNDLYNRVLARAAERLPRLIRTRHGDSLTEFQVMVSLTTDAFQPFHPRVDLASLNLTGNPIGFVASRTHEAGAGKQAKKQARTRQLRLNFDPRGAPIAWIRLQWETAHAVLKPPLFGPVRMAGPADQPLRLTVGYTDGSPTFRKELMPSHETEMPLRPEAVGLTRLVVDARPFAASNVRRVKVRLSYHPPHRPAPRQYFIQFEKDSWTTWIWLVSPTRAPEHYLDARWQIVCTDGSIITPSAAILRSSDSVLTLSGEKADVTN